MKQCIEDVAFHIWDGEQNVDKFAIWFLCEFPAFQEYWLSSELAKALLNRV